MMKNLGFWTASVVALAWPAWAEDGIAEAGRICLDAGHFQYQSDQCRGFRYGVAYQKRQSPGFAPLGTMVYGTPSSTFSGGQIGTGAGGAQVYDVQPPADFQSSPNVFVLPIPLDEITKGQVVR